MEELLERKHLLQSAIEKHEETKEISDNKRNKFAKLDKELDDAKNNEDHIKRQFRERINTMTSVFRDFYPGGEDDSSDIFTVNGAFAYLVAMMSEKEEKERVDLERLS